MSSEASYPSFSLRMTPHPLASPDRTTPRARSTKSTVRLAPSQACACTCLPPGDSFDHQARYVRQVPVLALKIRTSRRRGPRQAVLKGSVMTMRPPLWAEVASLADSALTSWRAYANQN